MLTVGFYAKFPNGGESEDGPPKKMKYVVSDLGKTIAGILSGHSKEEIRAILKRIEELLLKD